MAEHNRITLKKFFTDGSLPTSDNFSDLIDSTLNMNDEGFHKSDEHGFEISTRGKYAGLISFFRDSDPQIPLWSITLDHGQHNLTFNYGSGEPAGDEASADVAKTEALPEPKPALTLSPCGWVGVRNDSPACELDINGTMRCTTRLGTVPKRQLPANGTDEQAGAPVDESEPIRADGEWHNITSAMTGCQALEVMAGVGLKDSGRYALLHAIALNTFNPKKWLFNFLGLKNRIKCRHSYYRSRTDKLALRWFGSERRYFLQIRSNGNYGLGSHGEPVRINYHITELWTDPRMTQSWDVKADSQ